MGVLPGNFLCNSQWLQWDQELAPRDLTGVRLHWCDRQTTERNTAEQLTPLEFSFWVPGLRLSKQHIPERCWGVVLCSLKHRELKYHLENKKPNNLITATKRSDPKCSRKWVMLLSWTYPSMKVLANRILLNTFMNYVFSGLQRTTLPFKNKLQSVNLKAVVGPKPVLVCLFTGWLRYVTRQKIIAGTARKPNILLFS